MSIGRPYLLGSFPFVASPPIRVEKAGEMLLQRHYCPPHSNGGSLLKCKCEYQKNNASIFAHRPKWFVLLLSSTYVYLHILTTTIPIC